MKKNLIDWLSYMQQIHVSAIDMGLSRVLPVAEQLNLMNSVKNSYVFTVAGTNGKGSTTAIIAEVCKYAGLKTALYQSPHLLTFNERVKIDGTIVSDEQLIQAFEQVEEARLVCGLSLSFFEMTTLAAFVIFAKENCDVWVLEIGLGGRLDVVNIIDPNMSIITNVGIDHTDWLGDDREQIGYEKSGILRSGATLVYGETDMPESVKNSINALKVTCYQIGTDFDYLESKNQNNKLIWQYSTPSITYNFTTPKLSLINASNAITALLASDLNISTENIDMGLKSVQLIGRFDVRNIADNSWIFDVAHNRAGVEFLLNQLQPILVETLRNTTRESASNTKIRIIFSMLKDKEIETVVQLLQAGLNKQLQYILTVTDKLNDIENSTDMYSMIEWYIAPIDATHNPRSADIDELTSAVNHHVDSQSIRTFSSISEATKTVVTDANMKDLIIVCGSFHTIAECMSSVDYLKLN